MRVAILDAPNYFLVDQRHLLLKLRGIVRNSPIYAVVNPKNQDYQARSEKLQKIWQSFNVKVVQTNNVDRSIIETVREQAKFHAFYLITNNGRLLWEGSKFPDTIFIRVLYRGRSGKPNRPSGVFDKLIAKGYKVLTIKVLNSKEGAIARVLGFDPDEADRLWDKRAYFERSVVKVKTKVLPQLKDESTLSEYQSLCEENLILHPIEALYFLAIAEDVQVRRENGQVLIRK